MEFLFLHYHGNTNENAKLIIHVNIGKKTDKLSRYSTYSLNFNCENSFGFFIYINRTKKTSTKLRFFCWIPVVKNTK